MRMRITFVVLACAVVLLGGAFAAFAQPTPPFDSNAECLECHDLTLGGPALSKVDFASTVDYSKCASCHWATVGSSWGFPHEKVVIVPQCSQCHRGPNATARWAGEFQTPFGFFASIDSLSKSAAQVHGAHINGSWPLTTYGGYCVSCHGSVGCETCHTVPTAHGRHVADTATQLPQYAPLVYKTSYGSQASANTRLESNYFDTAVSCVVGGCHPRAQLLATPRPECGNCHPLKTDTHGYETVDHVADDGLTGEVACSACHALDLSTEHAKASSSSATDGCTTCHPAPRDTFSAWDQSCVTGGCHSVGSTAPYHAASDSAHAVVPAGAVCLGCHRGTDLGSIHAGAVSVSGATSCLVCHTSSGSPATSDCTVCHFTFDGHYDEVVHTSTWSLDTCGGAACHTTNDLMGVHAEKNPAFECAGCHSSTDPGVVAAITGGLTACDACHTGISESQGHRAVHWANPPLVGGTPAVPNYAYVFGTAGGVPTADCAGCHTGNLVDEHMGVFEAGQWTRLPRADSAGRPLDCATCHDSLDAVVGTAIALGQTRCDACHVVHDAIPATHASTYAEDRPIDCAGCHASDLSTVHGPSMSTSTPSGRVLSGCALCHDNTEGERGLTVQAAISTTNDTRCTACHASYHDGSSSHEATSSASVTDCGPCHGGGTSINVQVVHANASRGACAVCHANPARVPDLGAKTAECAGCHATQGTDFHRQMATKHVSAETSRCNTCHHSNPDVSVVHRSVGCLVCHDGTTVTEGVTAACTDCHPESEQGTSYHLSIDTAHTPTDQSSADCARCHQSTDLRVVHDTAGCLTCHNGACADCHAMHGGMGSFGTALLRSTACVSCHPVAGTDYHAAMPDKHTFSTMDAGCTVAGCHVANTLPEVHEPYLARYPEYTDTCALCHLNADPTRIDWASASADCSSCHEVHSDLGAAHTATASDQCVRCHDTADVRDLHPTCSTCHNGTVDTSGTVDCANCHTDQGTDYHTGMSASHVGFTSAGCAGTGCHPSGNVVDAHARYVGPGKQFPQYQDTCALCHLNADPGRINWATINGSTCGTCHGWPHDRQKHTATSSTSQECVACHETNWVIDVHGINIVNDATEAYKCNWCHDNPTQGDMTWNKTTSDCEQCHDKSPAAGKHYAAAPHEATAETGCQNCHYMEMAPEHDKATAGPVDCVTCHETKVDAFTGAWDKTCAACHAARHDGMNAKHASTRTECGGSGCHNVADAADVHKGAQGGGCKACHTSRDALPTTTDCLECHNGAADHHELHNATPANPVGCQGCHFGYLDEEHAALGYECATCHDSTDPVVAGAIASNDVRCLTCHPDSIHNAFQAYEFETANASMHRVDSTKSGMRSSFLVNGTTYTMTLPSAASFLKPGLTYDSMVGCTDCHSYSGAAGPHGATMQTNIDPAYSASWKGAYLSRSSTGMARSGNSTASDVLCAKCHDLYNGTSWSNKVHAQSDHQGSSDGKCTICHAGVVHGWGRPRMLATTLDPLPYRASSGGLTKFKLRNYTPTNWTESDCEAACGGGDHDSSVATPWPNVTAADIPSAGGANLAAGKTFTASRYASSTYAPAKAGDSDSTTRWWSNTRGWSTAVEYLQVDLGAPTGVSRFEIEWYGSYWAREYRIYTSTNGTTWTQVYATTNGSAGINEVIIASSDVRYVKVECRRTGTGYSNGYAIAELRVYK